MRGRSLRGGQMGSESRVRWACALVFACIWLGSMLAPPAGAAGCPNAQFRSGPSERLPDCRAYEQVSPVEKAGLDAVTFEPTLLAQASACEGDEACAIAYMNVGAAFAGAQGSDIPNAYAATREAGGWNTAAVTPPSLEAPSNSKAKVSYSFSPSLSQAVLRVPSQQLTEGAPAGVYNLFLRTAGGDYSLVTPIAPTPPPQAGCADCFEKEDVPAFAGASSDFSHILFEANDSLVAGAPGEGAENLYESVVGSVRLVGILPDETIAAQGATAGAGIDPLNEHAGELDHVISQDGSRVIFEAAADNGGPDSEQEGETELYDRIDGSSTVELSAPAAGAQPSKCETPGGVCNAEPATFWSASADGSFVYFTSKAALTRESYTGVEPTSGTAPRDNPGNDLYRYDLDTRTLMDLTPDAGNVEDPNGASVLGVVGSSEDGSYVYFVAEGHLGDAPTGQPTPQPNLYVWHETAEGSRTVRFIAALEAPDEEHREEEEEDLELMRTGPGVEYRSDIPDWTTHPTESQAYVTPDGRHLAFMSVRPLSGYDNEDQATGEADHEVFEYSAEGGQLVCASCDASGAQPRGSAFIGTKLSGPSSSPFHAPRALSDDGSRVFFSSPDPLVPELSGGSVKVFEYEDGGVQLISGPETGGQAVFLDASTSGDDVFFATRERLAPADADELVDVYDARVDGGLPAPSSPASCQGGACQEPFSAQPSFALPISAAFTGSGNLPPTPTHPTVKLTSRQLLHRALARCDRVKSKNKRAVCVRDAKRRYALRAKRLRRGGAPQRRR
jgi:WD40-like Beta Propeller Repeat